MTSTVAVFYFFIKDVLWRQYKLRTCLFLSACFERVFCYLSQYSSERTLYDLPLEIKFFEYYIVQK